MYIREFGEIHKSKNNSQHSIDKICVNNNAFKELENLAESDDKNNRFLKFKKSNILKVQNFVGVITTTNGTQIEILPKISESCDDTADKSRETLEKMLKEVNKLPFIETTKADLQLKKQPLPEVLISWFLDCVDNIIKQGIRRDYNRISANEKFLKGQLQSHKQLNEPPHKQHLFHIEYDVFSPNRCENRLIHSALLQVLRWSKDNENQKIAKHFLMFFAEVPLSKNYKIDFEKWSNSRDMNYYQNVLPWLKLILNQQSPFTLKDKNTGISFLIPMEKLFEKYVAEILAKNLPKSYELTEQKPQKYLAQNPKSFKMMPDIVISEKGEPICILDTKWKLIDENQTYDNGNENKKKGISQADMYQLFAYGKKYKVSKVVLIYPQWEKFKTSFSFKLDNNLMLKVCAFNMKIKQQHDNLCHFD
ncbi:McrBC 5-methylcytosine restriction system component [hydrothermal vent metagenome]|uniref:McrBC 5-methylcytosine restriction system component n=1 Tax=hydrothermal vent metagenome TaxID=652676 RepID=A0A1W1BVA5_9ZZZZ